MQERFHDRIPEGNIKGNLGPIDDIANLEKKNTLYGRLDSYRSYQTNDFFLGTHQG